MKELMSKQQMSLGGNEAGPSAQIKALEDILAMLKEREGMKLSGKLGAPEAEEAAPEGAEPGLDPKLEEAAEGDSAGNSDEDELKKLYASMKL